MKTLVSCPRCGSRVEPGIGKCPSCGRLLECLECHEPLSGGEDQCPHCGASFLSGEEEKAAALSSIFPASDPENPCPEREKPRRTRGIRKLLAALSFLVLALAAWLFYSWQARRVEEERAWQAARDSATLGALSSFLARYPGGVHFGQADSLFRVLKQADDRTWEAVSGSGKVEPFQSYLAQYPHGLHAGYAVQKIDSLRWSQALMANTEESYAFYLDTHPDGAYVVEAQIKKQALEKLKLTEEEEAAVELTMEAYCRAVQDNDENALVAFFEPVIELYYGKKGAVEADVLQSQRAFYGSAVLNMAFGISGDFTSSKDEAGCYHTAFPVEWVCTHADSVEPVRKRLLLQAVLSPNLKIKMITSEEQPFSSLGDAGEGE